MFHLKCSEYASEYKSRTCIFFKIDHFMFPNLFIPKFFHNLIIALQFLKVSKFFITNYFSQQPTIPFSKPAWPASSAQKLMMNGKPKNHPVMLNYDSSNFTTSKSSEKIKLPDYQRDMSVSSVASEESYAEKSK